MEYGVGDIVEGRVTGITKFGAFVRFGEGKSGLVHISEIANTYVREVSEHLQEGQMVKAKILAIDENGRINLSIKQAQPPMPETRMPRVPTQPIQSAQSAEPQTAADAFEDKLKAFMADSQNRMSDIKHQSDRKSGASRPRRGRS